MIKNKFLFSVVFILFFTRVFSQETTIENTQLQLQGDCLIITYDVVGTKVLNNVWLDIQTTSGKIITAKTLSGDIGRSIPVGKGKKISWNMKTDSVDLQGEELNVKVLATKKTEAQTNILTDITETFIPTKQSKNRDIVLYTNGSRVTGILDRRFFSSNVRFVSAEGNILSINANDIKRISNNGHSKDSVFLKNGDVIYGTITEIYPNDRIIMLSKTQETYIVQCMDIKSVSTYTANGKGYFAMPLLQFWEESLLGIRIGYIDNFGYYVQLSGNNNCNIYEIGISKHIYNFSRFTDVFVAGGINYGGYKWKGSYVERNGEAFGADLNMMCRYKNCIFNIGMCRLFQTYPKNPDSYEEDFIPNKMVLTLGVGYSF